MAKKRIRRVQFRLTTDEHRVLTSLCRLAGCSESVLIRDLIHASARAMHLLEPLEAPRSGLAE